MGRGKYVVVSCFLLLAVCAGIAARLNNNVAQAVALAEQPVTVVIDAGHGGEDGGAVGISGVRESVLNLTVALRLEQIFALCGIRTAMIRTEDKAVYTEGSTITEKKVSDLKHRVEIVNGTWNAVLVSIHQNHFPEPVYKGAQVFYAGTERSRELGELTQDILRQTLDGGNRRQSKRASSVYLMEQICCPGILVECGFLSNAEEEQLLCQSDYQLKIACAIGASVAQFLEEGNQREV